MDKIQYIGLLKYFVNILKNFKISLFFILFTAIILALGNSLAPYIIKETVDQLNQTDINSNQIYKLIAYYIILFVVIFITNRIYNTIIDKNLIINIRKLILKKSTQFILHELDHKNNNFNTLANNIQILINDTTNVIINISENLLRIILLIFISMFFLYKVNLLFLLILLTYLLVFISITFFFAKNNLVLSHQSSNKLNYLFNKINNLLLNLPLIKIYALNHQEQQKVNLIIKENFFADAAMRNVEISLRWIQGSILLIMQVIIFFTLIYLKIIHLITVGDFILITSIFNSLADRLWNLSTILMRTAQLFGKISQALSIFSNENHNIFCTIKKNESNDSNQYISKGEIKFHNMKFSHQSSQNETSIFFFDGISITIQSGKKTALVGNTSSGKTTFIQLLIKMISPNQGNITIDNCNIKNIPDNIFHKIVYLCTNSENLNNYSIEENIFYTTEDNPILKQKFIESFLQECGLHQFITNLPNQYQTIFKDNNNLFNNEQKQLINLSRAFLQKQSKILIFDNPLNHISLNNTDIIINKITECCENKTTIISTDNINLIKKMDIILFFDNGKITQYENPEKFIKSTQYTKYINNQLQQQCKNYFYKIYTDKDAS